ncbi:hypothetical protein WA026_017802 [Henosepilachna vigintioctopunctata]|uniref:Uncharacterized protein n=1 Tax=Henosepilachna vigintioctopunctata TaxID=420089 RepID=A0AAW1TVA8_9CUCU
MNYIFRTLQTSKTFIWNNLTSLKDAVKIFSPTNKNVSNIINKHPFLEPYPAIIPLKTPCIINTKQERGRVIPVRNIHSDNRKVRVPKTPDLIYFPHLTRWLKTKLKFKYLKRVWDPTFSEGAFIYGSTQAVCRITEIINSNKVSELDDLLTSPAKMKLVEDMTNKMTMTQREIIKISPRDVKILVPMSVDLVNNGKTKQCKILMRILALKWFPQNTGYLRLVLVALQSEFLKDYTHGINQDWNISGFDVMECTVLTETPARNH